MTDRMNDTQSVLSSINVSGTLRLQESLWGYMEATRIQILIIHFNVSKVMMLSLNA